MRDFNALTCGLCLLGVYSIGDAFWHWPSVDPLILSMIGLLIIVFDLFPIQTPGGVVYSGGTVGFMYLLVRYGFSACELGLILGAITQYLRLSKWRIHRVNWYRCIVTVGMYTASAGVSLLLLEGLSFFSPVPLVVKVFLSVAGLEIANAVILGFVYRSIGNQQFSSWTLIRMGALPVTIFTAVLTRFLIIKDGTLLVKEVLFTLFFLCVIYTFSVQYRKMADKHRESEEKYRLIAENTLDVIMVLDKEGRVTYTSPSHLTVMGWNSQEMDGASFMNWIHPEECEDFLCNLVSMRETRKPFQAQFRYLHAAGEWIVVEGTGSPVLDSSGQVDKVVMVIRDISERIETEELLRKSDKLAVVGQLAAGVAHELRNPLTALKGFLQLLRSKIDTGREYVNIMLSELNRIELIISEFLILAKPHVVQYQHKNPQELLQNVIALLDTQAILNNVQIVTKFDPEVPTILCEENQMKQVFINILKNGIEAMPGGGQITIEIARSDEAGVAIRFQDRGVGIPEENLVRLGEPFYTTKEAGTGLGLMVSYRIVQAHRGQMQIHSQLNEGTTVEIYLPAAS